MQLYRVAFQTEIAVPSAAHDAVSIEIENYTFRYGEYSSVSIEVFASIT